MACGCANIVVKNLVFIIYHIMQCDVVKVTGPVQHSTI